MSAPANASGTCIPFFFAVLAMKKPKTSRQCGNCHTAVYIGCCYYIGESFMKLTVSCAEKLNCGYNFRHDTASLSTRPLAYTYLWIWVQTQKRIMDGYRMVSRHVADALRRVATILQVCCHVLPSASSRYFVFNVSLLLCLAPETSHSCRGRVLYFVFPFTACSSVVVCCAIVLFVSSL